MDSGEEFTVSVTALDVENLNAYGTIIDYDPDQVEYVGTAYTGTGSMYTQGMTGNIVNDDGTAYVNHNAVNMGDQPLVNGSKVRYGCDRPLDSNPDGTGLQCEGKQGCERG